MSLKIIFMSSGGIGTPVLKTLIESHHKVVAVYTNPLKTKKSRKMNNSLIQDIAQKFNINIFTPKTFKSKETKEEFLKIDHDIVVVASYGFILPDYVIFGKYEAINLHPSILPFFRGAAPIERTIESGEKETQICTMFMASKLDAGDVIERYQISISEDMNSVKLMNIVCEIGPKMIVDALNKIENNEVKREKQTEDISSYANKIEKSELKINTQDKLMHAYNKIRAFATHGHCYILVNQERIKIIGAEYEKKDILEEKVGFIDEKLNIYFKDGILKPLIVQKQGKKIVDIREFLKGWKLNIK